MKVIAYGFSVVKGGVPDCSGTEKVTGKVGTHMKNVSDTSFQGCSDMPSVYFPRQLQSDECLHTL